MIQFGIICEGVSEANVISHIIQRYLRDYDVVVNPIQPEISLRGKQVDFGGWREVFKHCMEDIFEYILSFNDYIVIQIDTDVCEEVGYDIKKNKEDGTQKTDDELYVDICERLLKNIPVESKGKYEEKIIYAVCFNEIECWLLPVLYTEEKKCRITQSCINKLNDKLKSEDLFIPDKDKNSPNAKAAYSFILKQLKKGRVIKEYSQFNLGFNKFIIQLDDIAAENIKNGED